MSRRYYVAAGYFSTREGRVFAMASTSGAHFPSSGLDQGLPVVSRNEWKLFEQFDFAYHVYEVYPGRDVAKLSRRNERIMQPDFRVGIVRAPWKVRMSELQFLAVQRAIQKKRDEARR